MTIGMGLDRAPVEFQKFVFFGTTNAMSLQWSPLNTSQWTMAQWYGINNMELSNAKIEREYSFNLHSIHGRQRRMLSEASLEHLPVHYILILWYWYWYCDIFIVILLLWYWTCTQSLEDREKNAKWGPKLEHLPTHHRCQKVSFHSHFLFSTHTFTFTNVSEKKRKKYAIQFICTDV